VRDRPHDPARRQALGEHRVARGRPLEGLWDLSVAQELGADAGRLALPIAGALRAAGLPEAAVAELEATRGLNVDAEARDLAIARAQLAMGLPDAALAVLRGNSSVAGGSGPSASPEGLLATAVAADAMGHETEATVAIRRCRAATAGRPDLRLLLGRLALARGETKAARADLEAVAQARPGDEAALYWAGLADAEGKSPEEIARAADTLKRAVDAAPRSARAGCALGRLLYERQGKWERAAEIYRQALKIDPTYLPAEEGLARVTARLGLPEALYHEARAREMTARPEEAVALYRRWGARQPERWDSVLRAAECWLDLRRHTDAAREVQEGLKRFPNHVELYSHLSQIYLLANDRSAAARVCERWEPLDRTSGRPERLRGKLALRANNVPEAVRLLGEAVRKNDAVAAFHADLGEALVRDPTPEKLARARSAFERALELEPGNPDVLYQLGALFRQTGDPDRARVYFLRALDRGARGAEAYVGLVAVSRQLGYPRTAARFARLERLVRDQRRAEEAAREALSHRPRDPEARLTMAQALLRRGALAEASHHLQAAAPSHPEAAPLLRRVTRLLASLPEVKTRS
jgi:tetratricopeptide (TPR) repeat protein